MLGVISSLCILLAACGGGGGGGGSTTPTPNPTPNQDPTANAGPDQTVLEQTQVALAGSGADADGSITATQWTQISGTSVTLANPASANTTFPAPIVGIDETLRFRIEVTDNDGAIATDESGVTVLSSNTAPTANAGPDFAAAAGAIVTLSGSASDSDGTVAGLLWTQVAGPSVTLANAASSIASFTAPALPAVTVFQFVLTVTDNMGATANDQTAVTVAANAVPQITPVAPQTLEETELLSVAVNATDVEATPILSADLSLVPGATFDDNGDGTGQLNWTPPTGIAPGSPYGVVISAIDSLDAAVLSQTTVTVHVQAQGSGSLPITDNFSDGDANGWTESVELGDWAVVDAVYEQRDENVEEFDNSYHLGTQSILVSSLGLSSYRFSVDATPLSRSGRDIGVLFRYLNASNYYRLSINSQKGFTRLEKRVSGIFSTLAANGRGYGSTSDTALDNGLEAQQITIEVLGSLIQVFINGEPLFSVQDNDLSTGGIGIYSQDKARFDNILIAANDDQPIIVISKPLAHSVTPNGPATLTATAIVRNVPSPDGSVTFSVDAALNSCEAASEISTGVFSADCPAISPGNHTIVAQLFDNTLLVDEDRNEFVGVGSAGTNSHRYDAIGDSITEGTADLYSRNNLASADPRTVGFQGWPGLLGSLLNTATGAPNQVVNEGVAGDKTGEVLSMRVLSDIERNPDSNRALVLLGTNDTRISGPLPSGSGCVGAACNNTFKGNMLGIIDALKAAGQETIYIGLIPPAFGNSVNSGFYPDPINGTRNVTTRTFNNVIINELVPMANVELGPDFYTCFLSASANRFSLYDENIHPNGLGYEMMAYLWRDVLTGTPVVPDQPCPSPIYIADQLTPIDYKQNYLQVGNPYYTDEDYTLTAIPPEFEDGVWISTENGNARSSSTPLVSFNAGASPVTIYVAYDPSGTAPVSTTDTLTAVAALPSGQTLQANGGNISTFALVRAQNVAGTFTINGIGNNSVDNYLIIITDF